MPTRERLGNTARLYVAGVVFAGVIIVAHSIILLTQRPLPLQWAMLAVLTLLSGSFTVRIPGISARLSVSDTFVFAAVLLFGPAAATMIVVLDTLVISFWLGRRSGSPSRLLFNIAAPAVAIWAASQAFYIVARIDPLTITPQPILSVVLPLFGLATLYFLFNSSLVALAVGFQRGESAFTIWKQNFLWLSLNYFSGASVAALLLPYLLQANTYDSFLYVTGVLLPVLLIFYLTFKAALGRVDDANRHLSELNRLYLSTIETLAMAIDAKDQITHGHIRRVQHYAVRLATHIGVTEDAQISAIEAASLLHDMGKLAVPEYILNKPGKLTPAEFEKMKLHASVGADILSAIDFPYPVVPIVRHHHENWDGTGYPDGLKGTQIPIGARILAVVDCFDALTSDRPYRPRLPDSEAIHILLTRRGSMYDPLIVDAFTAVHSQIAPAMQDLQVQKKEVLSAIAKGFEPSARTQRTTRFDQIAASTEEMLVLYDLATAMTANIGVKEIIDMASRYIRRLVPAVACVLYIYDSDSDDLVAVQAVGEHGPHFVGLRIQRGERLTGWVAANQRTIANSDPVLDLGDLARNLKPRLLSCLSTPLTIGSQLVGVMTLYSTTSDAFGDDHPRIIEAVARQIAPALKQALQSSNQGDDASWSATSQLLNDFVISAVNTPAGGSIIVITLRFAEQVQSEDSGSNVLIERVRAAIRRGLRFGDRLFRYDADVFTAVLPATDSAGAQPVVVRLRGLLSEELSSRRPRVDVRIGMATAPADGRTLDTLMAIAVARAKPALDAPPRTSIH